MNEYTWIIVGGIGLVMFLAIVASCIHDLRRSRGNHFEELITRKDHGVQDSYKRRP